MGSLRIFLVYHFCDASASSIKAGNSLDVSSNAVHFFNRGGTNNIQIDISGNLRVGGGTSAQDPLSNVVLDVSWNKLGRGSAAIQDSAVAIRTNRPNDSAISIGATDGGGVDISGSSTTDGSNESNGKAAGAISISSTAGGMGLAWNNEKSLWAEGGRAIVTANQNAKDAIKLHASSGTAQTIHVLNTAGTDPSAVKIEALAGGVDITASSTVDISGDTVRIDGASGVSIEAGNNSNFTTTVGDIQITGAQGVKIGGGANIVDISGLGVLIGVGATTLEPLRQIKLSDGSGAYIDMSGGKIDISGDDVTITGSSGSSLNLRGPKINIGESDSTTDISGTLKVRGELQMDTSGGVVVAVDTGGGGGRIQTVVMNRTAGLIRMKNVTIVGGASGGSFLPNSYATTDLSNNKICASSVVLSSINCGGNGSERLSLSGGGVKNGGYQFVIANLGTADYTSNTSFNELEISFLVINPVVPPPPADGVAIADMPANRGQSPAVAGYNDKLYVFGGKYGGGPTPPYSTYDTFVVYDTVTDSWSEPTPTMSEKRAWVYGAIWQDKVYIYSGTDDQTAASHQSMEIYDITNNSFYISINT